MTAFEAGFYGMLKYAFNLPTLQYRQAAEEEKPSYKECVEEAAKQVFGIDDQPRATSEYGVTISKPGTKQGLTYMAADPGLAAENLSKKWSVKGVEPTIVGSGTREAPRRSFSAGSTSVY